MTDAFDFFLVVFVLTDIAKEFGKSKPEMALAITLTLAMRPIGAFIFGMTNKGIVYAEWNPDWFRFFLGAMLLIATVVNLVVRRRVERSP